MHYQQSNQMREFLVGRESKIADSFINLLLLEQREAQTAERHFINLLLLEQREAQTAERHFKERPESVWDYQKQLDSIKHQSIKPEQLFNQQLNNQPAKRLIVYGRAGIGKSVLCQYLATQWANDANQTMDVVREQFELVFWLKLRDLVSDYPQSSSNKDADTIIAESIKRHCGVDISQADWTALLKQRSKRILFILDGYDEIVDSLSERIDLRDAVSQLYGYGQVLLTSRPIVLQKIGNKPLGEVLELECIGFRDEDVISYVNQFMKDSQKLEAAEGLLNFVKARPPLWSMMHIPINCLLVCFLWVFGKLKLEQDSTLTQLYTEIVELLLERNTAKYAFLRQICTQTVWGKTKEITLGKLAIHFLSTLAYESMQQQVIVLKNIKAQVQLFIEQHQVKLKMGDRDLVLENLLSACCHLGLLKSLQEGAFKTLHLKYQAYYFIHLSFQEYLAADYYRRHIQWSATQEAQQLLGQIIQVKYEPRYQLMWRFVAGLLYQKRATKGTTGLLSFFQALLAKPREEIGITHLKLMAYCLDECQADKSIPLLAKLLEQQQIYLRHSKLRGAFDRLLIDIITTCSFTGKLLIADSVSLLKDIENQYVIELAIALSRRGDMSLPDLVSALQDEAIGGRARGKLARGLSKRDDVPMSELIFVLKNKAIDEHVRSKLAVGLSKRDGIPMSELVSVLKNETIDGYVKGKLAVSLAKQDDVPGAKLVSVLKDEEIARYVRSELAFSLAKRADVSASNLVSVLKNKTVNGYSRGRLAVNLSKRDDVLVSDLVSMLKDETIDGDVRIELAVSLAKRDDISASDLVSVLKNKTIGSNSRVKLAIGLAKRDDIVVSDLVSVLKNETVNGYSRGKLAVSLSKRDDIPMSELVSMLKDETIDGDVRIELAVSLAKRDDVSVSDLVTILKDETVSSYSRGALAVSLAKRDDISMSELVSILKDEAITGDVRCELAVSLLNRDHVPVSELVSILKDETVSSYSRGELAVSLAKRDDVPVSKLVSVLKGRVIDSYSRGELAVSLLNRNDVPVFELVAILENGVISSYSRDLAVSLSDRDDVYISRLASILKNEAIDGDVRIELALSLSSRDDIPVSELISILKDKTISSYSRVKLAIILSEREDVPLSALAFVLKDKTIKENARVAIAMNLVNRWRDNAIDVNVVSNLWVILLTDLGRINVHKLFVPCLFQKPELFLALPNFTDKLWLPLLYEMFFNGHILIRQLNESSEDSYWQLSYQGKTIKLPCTEPNFFIDKAEEQAWPISLYGVAGYASANTMSSILNTKLLAKKPLLSNELWLIHLVKKRQGKQVMFILEGLEYGKYFISAYQLVAPQASRSRLSFYSSVVGTASIQKMDTSYLYKWLKQDAKAQVCLSWLISPEMSKELIATIQRDLGKGIPYSVNSRSSLAVSTNTANQPSLEMRYDSLSWAKAKLRTVGIKLKGDWLVAAVMSNQHDKPEEQKVSSVCSIL